MKYSLLVLSAPTAGESNNTAYHFARALVDSGHELYRVFFYHEGVHAGAGLAVAAQDEVDPAGRWHELARQSGTELVLCIASAVKRGLLDDTEAQRHEKMAASIYPGFSLSGLGQLVDASAHSDRLITFGS